MIFFTGSLSNRKFGSKKVEYSIFVHRKMLFGNTLVKILIRWHACIALFSSRHFRTFLAYGIRRPQTYVKFVHEYYNILKNTCAK